MNFNTFYHSTKSRRTLKRLGRVIEHANHHEAKLHGQELSYLKARALELAPLLDSDSIARAELFALVREASRQLLGLRQHDVQLIGGLVLLEGKLAEMRTGEGKTLTIAAPCIAAALSGLPVHVVTVNEYLAARDAETLRPLYEAFGLTVGVLRAGQTPQEKQAAYACAVVYGVNHEFGFDYLRDNMATDLAMRVQRGLGFAIVDEVDSILIDEARTPLIISESAPPTDIAFEAVVDAAVRTLRHHDHYIADEKKRSATFTEAGYSALESALVAAGALPDAKSLYKTDFLPLLQHADQALVAHTLYRRDKHYVVQGGEIVIVDEATGRLMAGRRWGEGIHEAVEAKEGLKVKARTQTQATITYQNYFGLYQRLAGLTGTAATESEEFSEIYGLETVVVPPNAPPARRDLSDVVYRTKAEKFAAVVTDIATRHAAGQPVLVGTASVSDSERVSALLTAAAIPHAVLNARQAAQEAEIIARAGMPGAVTVSTNMAGRGTDILLGGVKDAADPSAWATRRDEVVAAGGLHVLGTERHESRRVDNQLRGRSGRQGDVGSSQFFISLEDRLLRVFAADKKSGLARLMGDGYGLSNSLVDKAVSTAQQRMEEQGFEARRELMKYDKVLASQRTALYSVRDSLLQANTGELQDTVSDLAATAAERVTQQWLEGEWIDEDFDTVGLKSALAQEFGVNAPVVRWVHTDELEPKDIRNEVRSLVSKAVTDSVNSLALPVVRAILLSTLDRQWVTHLTALDELRASIGLRAMAQQNPVYAFAEEGKRLFAGLRGEWATTAVSELRSAVTYTRAAAGEAPDEESLTPEQRVHLTQFQRFVTRNEPCPCGSGKRFKFCHGVL